MEYIEYEDSGKYYLSYFTDFILNFILLILKIAGEDENKKLDELCIKYKGRERGNVYLF